jgi:hypothetical protein
MPTISEFFGIKIYIYFGDHAPAHFHAKYAGEEAWFDIDQLTVMRGHLSPRARGLVIEWATLHQTELRNAWKLAAAYKTPGKIKPLR